VGDSSFVGLISIGKPKRRGFDSGSGNSLDKLHHTRSVAYSVELFLQKKQQISGGAAYPDNSIQHDAMMTMKT